jgi:hypothetical protein
MNLLFFMCERNRQITRVLYPFKALCLFKFLAWNVRECNISLFHRTMISGAVIKVSEFRVLHIHSNINSMQNNGGNMLIFIQAIITLVFFHSLCGRKKETHTCQEIPYLPLSMEPANEVQC